MTSSQRLASFINGVLNSAYDTNDPCESSEEKHLQLMESLKQKYTVTIGPQIHAVSKGVTSRDDQGVVVSNGLGSRILLLWHSLAVTQVLTGCTGSLGVHLLAQFLIRTEMRIVALVRAEDDAEAVNRLKENLRHRKLSSLIKSHWYRVQAFACDLAKKYLGLEDSVYHDLIANAVTVVHVSVLWRYHFACGGSSCSSRWLGQSILS